METRKGSLGTGMFCAMAAAGPIFVTTAMLAELYMRMPRPIEISAGAIAIPLILWPLAMVGGAIISFPANLLGGFTMAALADVAPALRPPIFWTASGLLLGIAVVLVIGDTPGIIAFALIATSAACARICRHWLDWAEPAVDEDIVYRWTRLAPPQ